MCGINNIATLFNCGTRLITGYLIPVIFALALVMFVWGVVNFFIINAGEEAKRTQGKQFMLWGIIALVVISSVWGIVRIFGNTIKVNTNILPGVRYLNRPFIKPTQPNGGGTNTGCPPGKEGTPPNCTTILPPFDPPQCIPGEECTDDTSASCPYLAYCSPNGFWP